MHTALRLLPFSLFVLVACGGQPATMRVDALAGSSARALQTPQEFQVAVMKAEMLRGEADADPGVIFDAGQNPEYVALVDLTEQAQPVWSGEVPPRYFGTYTHARVTLAAVGQVVDVVDDGGTTVPKGYVEFTQDLDNTGSLFEIFQPFAIARGEVLVYENGAFQWFQIDEQKAYTTSLDPSDLTGYRDPAPSGPQVVVELAEPITVAAGGDYVLLASFDITGTFEWTDLDSDGAFEPVSDDHDGTLNGFHFAVGVPGLAMELVDGL